MPSRVPDRQPYEAARRLWSVLVIFLRHVKSQKTPSLVVRVESESPKIAFQMASMRRFGAFRSADSLIHVYPPLLKVKPFLALSNHPLRNSIRSASTTTSTENLPRVAQPSIWHSIVPKAFRSDPSSSLSQSSRSRALSKKPKSKEWNPATFFIIIFLLIGSNAIQLITLRNETLNFSRKADAKIALLREVLERVQKGEDVDVERILGTGDEEKEKEWEEVMKEIQEEDRLWRTRKEKKEAREQRKLEAQEREKEDGKGETEKDIGATTRPPDSVGFY
ncbi:hypothetical protein MMC25_001489 [Agyrium rufum]|nr:hypothetical protein [Agyrium rufum]